MDPQLPTLTDPLGTLAANAMDGLNILTLKASICNALTE